METRATLYGVRLSAQKGGWWRPDSRSPGREGAQPARLQPKKGAQIIKKVLESAIANAEHNDGADIDELKVKKIFVEKGIPLKRFHARAKGRATA